MFKNYFKTAWRNLWRHKGMTFINVGGLGMGMAATVLIILWVQNELSFDQQQRDSAFIYRIKPHLRVSKNETWLWETAPYILAEHAGTEIPEVGLIARLKPNNDGDLILHQGDKLISAKKSAFVDGNWFKLFHYEFLEGSADAFNKNPFSLILTASTAKKFFGGHDAVGRILRMDTTNYQVQGVVKDNPANSSFQYDVLVPIASGMITEQQKNNALQWGNYNFVTFLKLKGKSNPAGVSAKLISIMRQYKKDDKGQTTFSLVNIKDLHFENDVMNSSFIHGNRTVVNVFMVLAGLLLITACINYVNLTTARASLRSREVSVRKIVGAGRLQLFGQFMSESFLVSLFALALSVLLVQVSMPWFRTFTGKAFGEPLSSPVTWLIIGVTLAVSFLLNGLYPAALLSSFRPVSVFRGKSLLNFKDTGLRRVLVVLQFTISVILITGTIVIYSQLQFMKNIDPGYRRAQVFSFDFPFWNITGFDFKKGDALLNTVKQEFKSHAATANVALAGTGLVNYNSQSSGNFDWKGRPKDFNPSFAPLTADADFQRLMHIRIKEGRWFNNSLPDKHNVLLNETAVELLHLAKPVIGQVFMHHGDTGVIIGIVKDFHYKSLHEKIGAMLISNGVGNGIYIKTNPGKTAAAIAVAGKIWKQYFPEQPFTYDFLDESYNNLYQAEQQSAELITLFSGIAILLSALGLLGLAAFAAEQRVKEIGIRKVLGASVQHIVSMLSVDFIKMVMIASLIAFPVAWWAMSKWLQDFAYRINLSWWIFGAAAAVALIVALITVSVQSVRAAVANPVKSLRSE
jgi:predicted permease